MPPWWRPGPSCEPDRSAGRGLCPSYYDGYYSPDVFGATTGAAVPLDDYDFGRDYLAVAAWASRVT
jgi:hypothetical protein